MSSSFRQHPRFTAATQPSKPALIMADTGESISYGELIERADRAAQLFRQLGLREGDTIALLIENHIRYPELIWAAKNSGLTYVCIPGKSSVDDAAYIVDNSDSRLLICSASTQTTASAVAARMSPNLQFLTIDQEVAPFRSYEDLLEGSPALPLSGQRRGPSMLYSSGTTGRPKGVRTPLPDSPPEDPPRRHAMLQDRYGFDGSTVLASPGPMYHAAPCRFMVCVQRCGGTVVAFKRFEAAGVLGAIEEYRATHALFVPTMFVRMLQLSADQRAMFDLHSLRCVVHLGAPCAVPVKEKMINWMGPIIEELYAGTESVGHTFISSDEWLQRKGSVGRPAPGCALRILDDEGRELPPFSPGLVYLKNGHRFEYHKDPEKTLSAIGTDGWGTLGDIGYVDTDGYLYLTDRQSHMIISGGVNIYPQEAENCLGTHPAVLDVAVIGIPHPEYGEEVKAVVQATGFPIHDAAQLSAELIDWCRARLSAVKCPRSVDFVEELPRNESGKLLKRVVRERYWAGQKSLIS